MSGAKQYFLIIQGQQHGPYVRSQLDNMWNTGAITADTTYWTEGMEMWAPIQHLFAPQGSQHEAQPMTRADPVEHPDQFPQTSAQPNASKKRTGAMPVMIASACVVLVIIVFVIANQNHFGIGVPPDPRADANLAAWKKLVDQWNNHSTEEAYRQATSGLPSQGLNYDWQNFTDEEFQQLIAAEEARAKSIELRQNTVEFLDLTDADDEVGQCAKEVTQDIADHLMIEKQILEMVNAIYHHHTTFDSAGGTAAKFLDALQGSSEFMDKGKESNDYIEQKAKDLGAAIDAHAEEDKKLSLLMTETRRVLSKRYGKDFPL